MSRKSSSRPTIRDIAREAGVSAAMVSRVLNDRMVTENETHERVRQLLDRRGYSRKKKVPAGGYLVCIGKTNPSTLSAKTLHFEAALTEAARAENYQLVISRGAGEAEVNQLIRKLHAVGVIRISRGWQGDVAVPLLTASYEVHHAPAPCVETDEAAYWRESLAWLAALGHRRVACFTHWSAREDDVNPFCDLAGLYRLAGLAFDAALICDQPFGWNEHAPVIASAFDRWFTMSEPPTAVILVDDVYADTFYRIARERQLCIPEDLNVIGRGNSPDGPWLDPPLTTHEDPIEELAAAAIVMMKQLQQHGGSIPHRLLIPPRRLPRGSHSSRVATNSR